ncbi:MAG: hypothetical protein ACRD9R_21935, partial [Pyrinomonadaceae bacterium]
VYQTAFTNVARRSGYLIEAMTAGIVATFRERAQQEGDGLLEIILKDVTTGPVEIQDSRAQGSRLRRGQSKRGKTIDASDSSELPRS